MRAQAFSWTVVVYVAIVLAAAPTSILAAITVDPVKNDVDPADPSTWINTTQAYVGKTGAGQLTVNGGDSILSQLGVLGNDAGAAGEVSIDGVGSTWTNSGSFYVGYAGGGTLNITAGGAVSNGAGFVGSNATSTGAVNVDGSTWTNSGHLHVGDKGTGTVTVGNGGVVNSAAGILANEAGSTGEVAVDGSTWTNASLLVVGSQGAGTMTVSNGGHVSSAGVYMGLAPGSTGTATVDGTGSTWSSEGEFHAGYAGTGRLTIRNGGLVRVGGALAIDDALDSGSWINMSDGAMLAVCGRVSGALDLDAFLLEMVGGTDAINYWDGTAWSDITHATVGSDYTLALGLDTLDGYTVLTVDAPGPTTAPVPSSLMLLSTGLVLLRRRRRR